MSDGENISMSTMLTPDITTERLLLRPFRETDAPAEFRAAQDPRIGALCGWRPPESVEESLETIRTVFAQPWTWAITLRHEMKLPDSILADNPSFADLVDAPRQRFSIFGEPIETVEPEGDGHTVIIPADEVIGAISLQSNIGLTDKDGKSLDLSAYDQALGYWVAAPLWRNGIATEASQALLKFAFTHTQISTIWGRFKLGNAGSQAVMRKIGMSEYGEDHHHWMPLIDEYWDEKIYCITRQEWGEQQQ